jgi:hypothetical protein
LAGWEGALCLSLCAKGGEGDMRACYTHESTFMPTLTLCTSPRLGVLKGGEGDLRACYIAMAVAHMLCLDKVGVTSGVISSVTSSV